MVVSACTGAHNDWRDEDSCIRKLLVAVEKALPDAHVHVVLDFIAGRAGRRGAECVRCECFGYSAVARKN